MRGPPGRGLARAGAGVLAAAHDPLVPHLHTREDELDRDVDQGRDVAGLVDDVLAGDDRVSLASPALTTFICRVISLQVARRVSGSLGPRR